MANLIITIDGPAASGKSTVAQLLAKELGASFLDTGAMYRTVTLAAMQDRIDVNNEQKLLSILENRRLEFFPKAGEMGASIDGIDVTRQIRSAEVTANARYIASAVKIREKLVQMQRQFAAGEEKIVTEGRDQGTVAFADADIKFYLTADAAERARRRQAQQRTKGNSESLDGIRKAIVARDKSDRSRPIGPLTVASDAIIVDTTNLNIEQVVEKLLGFVKEKCSGKL
ncbi:MAG: (d)CMP kinase [Sedimentisphaerales bacterium]|nr:(d)CMP kinase [Sedimentisphaerales bacterium]